MSASEVANCRWLRLLKLYGAFELERRMSKLPSYRAYVQRWPFDVRGPVVSLDVLLEAGYEVADQTHDLLDVVIAQESIDEFKAEMTPRQVELSDKLEAGYKPKEFYRDFGYKNTGGLRWHKFIMKQKLKQLKDQEREELNG